MQVSHPGMFRRYVLWLLFCINKSCYCNCVLDFIIQGYIWCKKYISWMGEIMNSPKGVKSGVPERVSISGLFIFRTNPSITYQVWNNMKGIPELILKYEKWTSKALIGNAMTNTRIYQVMGAEPRVVPLKLMLVVATFGVHYVLDRSWFESFAKVQL